MPIKKDIKNIVNSSKKKSENEDKKLDPTSDKDSNKSRIESSASKDQKLEVADLLVKILVPYLKSGKICDKASFKLLARELTHLVMKMKVSTNKIDKFVRNFFSQQSKCISESNARECVK